MQERIIEEKTVHFRSQTDQHIKDLQELSRKIGHVEMATTLDELRSRLFDPYLFVIVGEVKAGKSSFINALLKTGRDICAVSPAPMTDTIQQITYGETEGEVSINPYLKKIFLNESSLKDIAIVDTPGTNTIISHHQEITERFIPVADLIIFVFEGKNPYRQSAWDFLNFIKDEWKKKIVFVLQQKDLLSPNELATNVNGLFNQAQSKGIQNPTIFCVSAKEEQEGKTEQSGFYGVRAFIQDNVTGGKALYLKLSNNLDTVQRIIEQLDKHLLLRKEQLQKDQDFRDDLANTLDHQETKSNNQVDMLTENLINTYDKVTLEKYEELDRGLSFGSLISRSFSSIFNSDASTKKWLEGLTADMEKQLGEGLKNKLQDGVLDLVDSIQQMARMVELKIKNGAMAMPAGEDDVFTTIIDKRNTVLKELQETFSQFIAKSENFSDENLISGTKSLAPNLVTGGGLAIIGVLITAITKASVLDITGGVITAFGVLFAGITVTFQRGKVLRQFKEEIDKGRNRLNEELNEKLKTYVKTIKRRINENFHSFDDLLQLESKDLHGFTEELNTVRKKIENIQEQVG